MTPAQARAAAFAAFLLAACATEASRQAPDLAGVWASAPVVFDRGDFDETYRFTVAIDAGGASGVMDIAYFVTNDPASTRVIRQDLSIAAGAEAITLAGASPRLLSGPAVVGVYAPDMLYCDPLTVGDAALDCRWGSDGHAAAPQVRLQRAASRAH